jgi:hypothetical protein
MQWVMHHVTTDLWSYNLLVKDLDTALSQICASLGLDLRPPAPTTKRSLSQLGQSTQLASSGGPAKVQTPVSHRQEAASLRTARTARRSEASVQQQAYPQPSKPLNKLPRVADLAKAVRFPGPPPPTYREWTVRQHLMFDPAVWSDREAQLLAYWTRTLHPLPPPILLPVDCAVRPPKQTFIGAAHAFSVGRVAFRV